MFKAISLPAFLISLLICAEGAQAQENCLELFQKNVAYTDPFSSEFSSNDITKEYVNDLLVEDYGFFASPFSGDHEVPRAKRMTELAKSIVEARKPSEAVIIFNGIYHSYDLYGALGNRSDVSYSTASIGSVDEHPFASYLRTHFSFKNFNKEEIKELAEFLELIVPSYGSEAHKAIFTTIITDTFQKMALDTDADIVPTYFVVDMQLPIMLAAVQRQNLEQLSFTRPNNPSVWVFGDWHFTAGLNFMTSLPTAAELKSQGLQEVTLLIEGLPQGQVIELELAQSYAKTKLSELAINRLTDAQLIRFGQFLKSTRQLRKLREAILNEPAIFHPAYSFLLDRAATYETQGIKVKIIGMH